MSLEKPLAIVVTGNTVPRVKERFGDFDAHFAAAIGDAWTGGFVAIDARSDEALPTRAQVAGAIVTGSSSSVTERAPWMLRLEGWLRSAVDDGLPLLGVCFGHQALAQALGGEVRKNARGRHIGSLTVTRVREDPLFEGVPARFFVNVSHQDHVATFPPAARMLASAGHDELHAFAAGRWASAVQFHPEFHAEIVRDYITTRREILLSEGLDADALHAAVVEAPHAQRVLRNFVTRFVLGPGRK